MNDAAILSTLEQAAADFRDVGDLDGASEMDARAAALRLRMD